MVECGKKGKFVHDDDTKLRFKKKLSKSNANEHRKFRSKKLLMDNQQSDDLYFDNWRLSLSQGHENLEYKDQANQQHQEKSDMSVQEELANVMQLSEEQELDPDQ